mgnify:FL=1
MKLIFELNNGSLQWTDIYDIDRWGNVKSIAGPLRLRSEYRAPIEAITEMLDNYFRNVAEPNDAVKPRIEWDTPTDPIEVSVFLSHQVRAQLLWPHFKPVPEHQPRKQ